MNLKSLPKVCRAALLIGWCLIGSISHVFGQCQPPQVDLGPDVTVCGSVDLEVDISNIESIRWSNGRQGVTTIQVTSSGTYWVGVSRGCGYGYDTVNITIKQQPFPGINIQDSVYFCSGDSVFLDAGSWDHNATYLWDDGSSDTTNTYWSAGSGWVEVTNECGTVRKEFEVLSLAASAGNFSFLEVQDSVCADSFYMRPTVTFPEASYTWSTGSSSRLAHIKTSGTYWLEVTTSCGVFTDTMDVVLSPDPVPILKDTIGVCQGFGRYIGPPSRENATYNWSTGESTDSILVSAPGTYWFEAHGACESIVDTVHVIEVYPISSPLPNDTSFCEPNNLLLDVGYLETDSVRWSNGSPSRQLMVDTTGSYWVEIYNACGRYTDTVNVQVDLLPRPDIGDTAYCAGSEVAVSVQDSLATSFAWSTGESSRSVTIGQEGLYYVDVSNHCGTVRDSFYISEDLPIDPFSISPDTAICDVDTPLTLTAQVPEATHYRWMDTTSSRSFDVYESGTYWITAWNACNSYTDTIEVEVQGVPEFSLGRDTIFCYDSTLTVIEGPPGMERYEWNTGETSRSISIDDSAGYYELTVENKCYSYTDSLLVDPQQEIELDLGPDTSLCFGEMLTLDPEPHRYGYAWSDGSTDSVLEVTRPGTYWVFSSNACDFYYDTVQVDFHYPLDSRPLDTTLCEGDSIVFDFTSDLYNVEWGDDFVGDVRTVEDTGEYSITIHNECGSYRRDISIGRGVCDCPFFAADAFTPNRDGDNDTYFPKYGCDLSHYKMTIVSKAGGILFETEDPTEGWDGTFNGERMPQGVYIYQFEYRWSEYGVERSRTKRGTVLLIR